MDYCSKVNGLYGILGYFPGQLRATDNLAVVLPVKVTHVFVVID